MHRKHVARGELARAAHALVVLTRVVALSVFTITMVLAVTAEWLAELAVGAIEAVFDVVDDAARAFESSPEGRARAIAWQTVYILSGVDE